MRVNKQVLVSIRIEKYVDEVLYDVAPMHAGHILLGRPWQFDRLVKHDGFTNKYSLVYNQRAITLVPLTLKQVYEDQVKLRKESEQKKRSDKKRKSASERELESQEREKLARKRRMKGKRGFQPMREKKERTQKNFYARASDVKRALILNQLMILLV